MTKKIPLILLTLIFVCLIAIISLQIYSMTLTPPMSENDINKDENDLSTVILAGLTDLEGSGVKITVSDSGETIFKDPEMSVIHDEDILSIINELYDADAEAISVNGERIVATSEIRCAGSTISINNNRYSQPYVIKAIGDPVNLKNAITMKDGIGETLSYYGIQIEIEECESLTVEAYKNNQKFIYATPIEMK